MISDSSAMSRIAANFVLELAARQNARSSAKDLPLDVRPQPHCMRRCLAASSRASMSEDYHVYHVTFQSWHKTTAIAESNWQITEAGVIFEPCMTTRRHARRAPWRNP